MTEPLDIAARVTSVPDLLAHALAMESEACERYGQLADQMDTCNNKSVAGLFRQLEAMERTHVRQLEDFCKSFELPRLAPWEYAWRDRESPETIDVGLVHYQISPKEAVSLAIDHEQRAADFYLAVIAATGDDEVRRLARQFADEENEHVRWLGTWLADCGPDASRRVDDPDPPNSLE